MPTFDNTIVGGSRELEPLYSAVAPNTSLTFANLSNVAPNARAELGATTLQATGGRVSRRDYGVVIDQYGRCSRIERVPVSAPVYYSSDSLRSI